MSYAYIHVTILIRGTVSLCDNLVDIILSDMILVGECGQCVLVGPWLMMQAGSVPNTTLNDLYAHLPIRHCAACG